MRIDLPAWLPDQSLNSGVLIRLENAVPAIDGYRPIGAFLTGSDALPVTFSNGASFSSSDGQSYLLVGTSTSLVRYSGGSWTNLVTGLTITERWQFVQFGDVAVTVNGSDTRAVDLVAGTQGTIAGAPAGASICVVGDFVVIGQSGGNKLEVTWSAFNDHTGWTAGVNQSGFQPMLTGGEVMGLAGGEYGVILQRQRLVRMNRTGDPEAPFSFDEISPNVGAASKGAIAQAGRTVFFLSDRGFMALEDGQALRPIGNEKIDRTFFRDVPRDDWSRLYCAVDPQNTLVWWMLPGSPGKCWIYNWVLDRWGYGVFVCDGVFAGFTSSTFTDALGWSNIDAQTFTVDDPRFSGGAPRLFFVQSGQVGTVGGAPLAVKISMGFVEFAKDRVARIRAFRPVGDMTAATCVLDVRQRLGDGESLKTAQALRTSGLMPVRATGKYVSTDFGVPAGATWTYVRAFEYVDEAGGLR